jgi:molecular chaperone HtpG
MVKDKGFEILYFTDDVDEFAVRMLMDYQEKEFRSVSGGDLGIEEKAPEPGDESKGLFEQMKQLLSIK